ncbi:hypothetical protein ACE1B6_24205 [Aerosakkonemataceae cyanobacterium BLCC-F154]|uniref:MerR family transcriptional regulator n=1 Tax=Floridaenema fluviatile BLCC-F154 TaxID=3153640 RepID=A0ABV4YHQ7_9CYAN
MENVFTRQQALYLTGLSSGQLSRLDNSGIVKPTKLGGENHRPTVLYSLSQIWELRTIATLRQKLSMQEIKKVVEYLRMNKFEPTLLGKYLIFCNKKLYWITADELNEIVIELSGKNKGQVVLKAVDPIGESILNVQREAESRQSWESEQSTRKTPVASTSTN